MNIATISRTKPENFVCELVFLLNIVLEYCEMWGMSVGRRIKQNTLKWRSSPFSASFLRIATFQSCAHTIGMLIELHMHSKKHHTALRPKQLLKKLLAGHH